MNHAIHVLVHIVMLLFMVGVAGCLLVIPVVAVKFAAVLFEKTPEAEGSGGEEQPQA